MVGRRMVKDYWKELESRYGWLQINQGRTRTKNVKKDSYSREGEMTKQK